MPQPKKQKAITKAIPKKAANSKAPSKPRKAAVPRTDSVTTNKVERAESGTDSEAPMAPEGSAPTLAPIFNANPCKVVDSTEALVMRGLTKVDPAQVKSNKELINLSKIMSLDNGRGEHLHEYEQWRINLENNASTYEEFITLIVEATLKDQ
ncbi:hypothetical protein L0F63_003571 [Massospora cicadina]|nr:hypothetical protein L0F63_003571 [Massospora cicadina]